MVGEKAILALMFSDMEGSTRLLRDLGDDYAELLTKYHEAISGAVAAGGGSIVDTQGDGHFAVFPTGSGAVAAAAAAQRSLAEGGWPRGVEVRARIGLHIGELQATETRYVGMDVHRAARIAAAGHGGQVLVSTALQRLVADDLPAGTTLTDLGPHRFKDLARAERVYQLDVEGLPTAHPPIRSLAARFHNLPVQLTSFVGREAELAAVIELIRSNRLVTLAASGGSGKTRLALQSGAELFDDFPDGVWLVELDSVGADGSVVNQVARALGVREQVSTRLEEEIAEHLRDQTSLLIFDNCEHVVGSAAALAAMLLQTCAQVKVLATSREALGITGEVVYRVPSLPLPLPTEVDLDAVAAVPAVQLFLDRATEANPAFELDEGNRDAVVDICRRLDGIPLALELAAARLRLLGPRQIANRLDDQFKLLTSGSAAAPTRHQTLETVMQSSYESLVGREQVLFRKLGTFTGGFTFEAAETVCCGGQIPQSEFLDLLARLVDTSLVVRVDSVGDEPRYRMLEPIRQYAVARLAEAGEIEAAAYAHAGYYASQAKGGGTGLPPPQQAEWLARREPDEGNYRAALGWALEAGERDLAVTIAGGLARYWYRRANYAEASDWFGRVLEQPELAPSQDVARILRFAAGIAGDRGDRASANRLLAQETEVATALGDPVGLARSLNLRASMAWTHGSLVEAARLYEEALAQVRPTKDAFTTNVLVNQALLAGEMGRLDVAHAAAAELQAWAAAATPDGVPDLHRVLGLIALVEGDLAAAAENLEQVIATYRRLEMRGTLAMTLQSLGLCRILRGEREDALRALSEALDLFDEMDEKLERSVTLSISALQSMVDGELDDAGSKLAEALEIGAAGDSPAELMYALGGYASLANARRKSARSAVLHGAAAELARRTGLTLPAPVARAVEAERDKLRELMGPGKYSAAVATGAAMSTEEAVEFARAP